VARAKALLRKQARGLRASMPATVLAERAERLRTRLLALEPVRTARRVALFWPMEGRKEVDLRPADAVLRQRGVDLFYPLVDAETGEMTFRRVADPAVELAQRGKRFAEPPPEAPLAPSLDVIVVPGLLFDASGFRIGYGGGYYDRTLPRYRPAALVGVAFDFQLAADLPHDAHDAPVHVVVTDSRELDCRR
jgi:5-formyltetrahydrofolate cyclo-ligase